jgi:HEAT repeat protein
MRFEDDSRTAQELFQVALQGDYDDEEAWDAVRFLRLRGTEEIFQLAVQYTRSSVPLERARGLDVLAQLGARERDEDRPHTDERVAIAIENLQHPDPLVVQSAAWALAHLGGDSAVSSLIPMRTNSDPDTRWAVANGLNGSERQDAIATLIELMDDSDDNVRDWATFALGTQCDVDLPEIREALRKRLGDPYKNARDEAVWGLAQHKDPHGIQLLIDRLSAHEWMAGDEMAAAKALDMQLDTQTEELVAGLQKLLDA